MKWKRLVIGGCIAAVIGLLFFLARPYLQLERLVEHEQRLREQIQTHRVWAVLIGFLSYFVLSLIPGTGGKAVAFGWLFGTLIALFIATIALTAAGTVAFLLSRYVLRDAIVSRFEFFRERINRAVERDGAFYLFAMRVLHVPYTAVNYAMGTTNMRVWTFAWVTFVGLLPGTAVFAYAGSQLPTLAELSLQGVHAFFTPRVILALVLFAIFPFAVRWIMRLVARKTDEDLESELKLQQSAGPHPTGKQPDGHGS